MLKSRKLHREDQDKDKLYKALRELYEDGVRICSGRLSAGELLERQVNEKISRRRAAGGLLINERDEARRNPYHGLG